MLAPYHPGTAALVLYARVLGQVVNKYIDQGVAELVPGVLFVDEVRVRPPARPSARVALLFLAVVVLVPPARPRPDDTVAHAARRGPAELGRFLAQHQVPVTSKGTAKGHETSVLRPI